MTRTKKRDTDVHLANAKLVIAQVPMRSPLWLTNHPQLVEDVAKALRSVEHRTLLACAERLRAGASVGSVRDHAVLSTAAKVFEDDAKKLEKP